MPKTKDLSQGSVFKVILQFAFPLFLGMLFQQFYNLFDTIIVGQALGLYALGGVGATGSINFMVIGLCNGVAAGCAIPVARSFGARDFVSLRKFIANSIYVGIAVTLVLTILSCVFCGDLLRLMQTLPENFEYANNYIFYIFLFIPVTFAYNLSGNVLRSLGNSKTPVIILLIAIIINIGLDVLFLLVFRLGVEFAAIATGISQLIAAIACIIYTFVRYDVLRIKKEEWKLEWNLISELIRMGLPMGLQYSITGIGSILLTAATNGLNNAVYVAAVAAGNKVSNFFCTPFDALGGTMATYTSQNVGAKTYDRLGKGVKSASLMGIVYAVFAFIIMLTLGKYLAMLFIDEPTDEIINTTYYYMLIVSSQYILLVFVNVVRFAIQGMGFSRVAIIAGVLEMIGRGGIALFFVNIFGFTAVCFAGPVAWVLADLFLIPCFIHLKNKMTKTPLKMVKV
jgi:putative MATE family efflux protein